MKKELLFGILLIGCESKRDEASKVDVDRDEPAMPAQTTREPAKPPAATKPPATAPPDEATPPAAAKTMTDASVAKIAQLAHDAEIDTSELAVEKSKNKDVVTFAKVMITEHGAAKVKLETTLGQAGVTPADSDASRQLAEKTAQSLKQLEGLEGAAFDQAYVAGQVKMHQEALDTIDSVLVPNAERPEVKALFVAVRPNVAKHLEHAKALEAKLAQSPS